MTVTPFTSILSYHSDTDSCTITVEFVRQARNEWRHVSEDS